MDTSQLKLKWFTVSINPDGYLGHNKSVHVEPGQCDGIGHQVLATDEIDAIKKTYGNNSNPKMIATGYLGE